MINTFYAYATNFDLFQRGKNCIKKCKGKRADMYRGLFSPVYIVFPDPK